MVLGGGQADVEGGGVALTVLLQDIATVELLGSELDHLRHRRRRAVVDHEDHGLGCGSADGGDRLEERFKVLRALGAHGDHDEGGDGFHVSYIGCPRARLEKPND
jgi:hypothetical protein